MSTVPGCAGIFEDAPEHHFDYNETCNRLCKCPHPSWKMAVLDLAKTSQQFSRGIFHLSLGIQANATENRMVPVASIARIL
jgi:hypothetical protein